MRRTGWSTIGVACTVLLIGCSSQPAEETTDESRVVQLGAPGEDNRELTAAEASELSVPPVTPADVEFVRMMIPHHEQALEMTALVPSRTERDDLPLLAERIEVSQIDEIEQMRRWLADQGHSETSHADHDEGHLMPGMLTLDELSQLAEARGEAFDELFLRYMIRHHEGAVHMVEELLTSGEGAQNPQVFQLAQHIDADQRVEIARMKRLLADL
ncbi:MAG: DUF305 domain-containing protein [Aldersonia sp.]|nr:DUF305 domain-containing protein [Aldersonia sp.]